MGTFLVGIAGGSASGKSTLTRLLVGSVSSDLLDVVELDGYYRAQDGVDQVARESVNYDHPNAFEFDLLVSHLRELKAGRGIAVPSYDFAAHNRRAGVTRAVSPKRVIIVEGILTFAVSEVRDLFDVKIYVDAPSDLRLARRSERDVRERGRSRESVVSQWRDTVDPMFVQFCEPSKGCADLLVDGREINENTVRQVLSFVGERCPL